MAVCMQKLTGEKLLRHRERECLWRLQGWFCEQARGNREVKIG